MDIDSSYVKDIIIPTLTLLLSIALPTGKWWFSRRLKGRDNRRSRQFDVVSNVKRFSVLSHIQTLRDKPQDGMVLLQIKALYESIGICLPVWVAHQLMDYLGRASLPLNSLSLNCFLRRVSLTSVKSGVFSLDANRLRHQRIGSVVFLIVSALAISYGFYVTVLPLGESEATASNTSWFLFFFVTYVAMAIFVVVWSIDEWSSLGQANDFWQEWQPHLCQTQVEYQVRCLHERSATTVDSEPVLEPTSIKDVLPVRKSQRGWLMRLLGKKK
jgi:hypothetical protein